MATVSVPRGTTDLGPLTINDADILQFMDGESNISAGNNLSSFDDAGTGGLTGLYFGPNATPIIEPAYALRADVDQGAGLVHIASNGGRLALYPGGSSGVFTRLRHIGATQATIMSGGTVTTFEQSSGSELVTGDVSVTTAYCIGGNTMFRYKSTAITTLWVTGGNVSLLRTGTTINVVAGVLTVYPENTGTNVPTSTTVSVYGGTFRWRGGDITTLNVFGPNAVVDFSGITQDITVSTVNVDKGAKRNPMCKWNGSRYTVTYTTKNVRGDENDAFPS